MPDKHERYRSGDKGKARDARWNGEKRRRSESAYMAREFVAWDGEGYNDDTGKHIYCLLANSDGASLIEEYGIGTEQVFALLLGSRKGVVNVIYGGSYDINMWLRDLPRVALETLYREGSVKWHGYYIEWRAGKSIHIATSRRRFTLYDVLPFFQRSFVSACDEYLGIQGWEHREAIIAGKARRGSFTFGEIGNLDEYNRAELSTLVRLVNALRERLYKVAIRVKRWDGPGAIATALYQKYETKSHLAPSPPMVAKAGRYAYAGGRFEIIRKGHSDRPAYQYDIRSAYPSAIRNLPCLTHGRWEHRQRPTTVMGFGIYRVETITPSTQSITQPQPLWMRNKDGTVYFPEYAHGWYWSPEAQMALDLGGVEIHESWELIQECDCQPFSFVESLYNKRAALKKAGDGAHIGLKLGLNSLYGKLAQQIGWDPGPPLRLPPYHSLEWAGYVTSHCRAQVYRASLAALDHIIAFETDAVFAREPLPLNIGERLGQWEATEYQSLTYLKSGMYYGTRADGKEVEKTRGINPGTLTRETVKEALRREAAGETVLPMQASQTRFITLGQALHTDFDKWTRWITGPREISVSLSGKRIDLQDSADEYAMRGDGWHETQEGFHDTEFSYPYEVEWIGKEYSTPDGLTLNEHRAQESDDGWRYE